MMRRPGDYQRVLVNQLTEPYHERVEIGHDVPIAELVRALALHGLTLINVAGRGLRIVRAPTPAQEDGR
jgi:hypothetical protein